MECEVSWLWVTKQPEWTNYTRKGRPTVVDPISIIEHYMQGMKAPAISICLGYSVATVYSVIATWKNGDYSKNVDEIDNE